MDVVQLYAFHVKIKIKYIKNLNKDKNVISGSKKSKYIYQLYSDKSFWNFYIIISIIRRKSQYG